MDREIRVDLDPDRMAALGATASDVSRQLRRIQVEYPGGETRVGGLEQTRPHHGHDRLGVGTRRLADRVAGRPQRAARHDRGRARSGGGAARQVALLDGQPVVGFQIVMRAWGASALDVAKEARTTVEELRRSIRT